MKPALKPVPDIEAPRSVADLDRDIVACRQQIAFTERDRNQKRSELQLALVSPDPERLQEARELKAEVARLDGQVEVLQERRRALEEALKETRARERQSEAVRLRAVCERHAQELRTSVARIESLIDEAATLCMGEVRQLDERFCRSLPVLPQGRTMVAFSRGLPAYLSRRFAAHIAGDGSLPGTFETGHQLLTSGRLDVKAQLEQYLRDQMRAFAEPSTPEPPKAA